MPRAPHSTPLIVFAAAVIVAVFVVYLTGLHNQLLFDDLRLSDGTVFGAYGGLLPLKPRLLSYGSFVWVDALFGSGWWKQRLVNLLMHLGTVAALYGLLRALLGLVRFPAELQDRPDFERSRNAALAIGVALFALHPVAVYAVAYLTQRSIVLATLFSVLACWLFVRGLLSGRVVWHGLALLAYLIALLCKEYAVMTVALALPLYVYVRGVDRRRAVLLAVGLLAVLGVALALLAHFYGGLIGRLIDPRSVAFARQLELLEPGITARLYPLSILNEAWLFFRYGFLWLVPNVQWLSIDLRPAFPLSFGAFPQLLGAFGYLALLAASVWALLRGARSRLAFVGLLLLFPLLLYATEFATIWLQDPFVLYRSYLWAIALPGLLALLLMGLRPRTIWVGGGVLALLFAALSLERVASLQDEFSAWGDAAAKVDLQAPANAVGRSRPYLNLGAAHLDKGSLEEAARAFQTADALGDLGGNAMFNLGTTYQQRKEHQQALTAFATAAAKGFEGQALHYQRGESEFALGQFDRAFAEFDAALQQAADNPNDPAGTERLRRTLLQRRAESAIGANRFDAAIADFRTLLKTRPDDAMLKLGLGMATVGKGDIPAAIALFDSLIARSPSAPAFYGRAMARLSAGARNGALADLNQAIALDPRNRQYLQLRAELMK